MITREEAIQKLAKAGRLSVAHAEDLYDSIVNKPVVPQVVADWVDNSREYDYDFDEWFDCNSQPDEIYKWLNCKNKRQSELNAFALVTLIVNGHDAVTVEKEPRYRVKLKNQEGYEDYLVKTDSVGYRFYNTIFTNRRIHTREEIESNGFGWVFDCEGIEMEEVE
ncbi:hypothetical protein PP261_gp05 [Streptococcus phage vB_SthS_VA214]|uniref:DUF1642 domain-containing protein n=1 Tax=Streptococcus phage vB_SthS_VA214 TaxID=2069608 RepID=A0A2I6QQU0_9CAUD|nr:hypothetical protein PP261_gp05 [Streptococcus phage vB_SthS_VA214]AUN43357.1 hypothetical protein [Streptococcus phage vB_SthS_VA214]